MTKTFINFKDGKMVSKNTDHTTTSGVQFTGWFKGLEPKASPYSTTQWSFHFVTKDYKDVYFVGDNFNRSIITMINMLSTLDNYLKPITIKTELKQTRKNKEYTYIHMFSDDKELIWNTHIPSIPRVKKDSKGNAVSDVDFQQMFLYLYANIQSKLNNDTYQRNKLF